ncbi:MAG: hypothetical protein PHC62_03915 [Candidatus Izemoplasmatales bacterium]|nr:hypothetical protein [Candidatus Izemoplasmatales bacterium]
MVKKVLTKEERIKKEKRRLKNKFSKLDKETTEIVDSLLDNASFMRVTLEDLQVHINENGITCEYQNGKDQWGKKKSPEAEMYNTMIKNYTVINKQLIDLLPKKEKSNPEDDDFDEFLIT